MPAQRPTEHRTQLGKALSEARTEAGIRQREAAKLLGNSQSSIVRLEKGAKIPTREELNALLDRYAPTPELRRRIELLALPEEQDALALNDKFDEMLSASEAAVAIHTFHSERIPMTLQCDRYALKQYCLYDPSVQHITVLRLRERRMRIFEPPAQPAYHAIMTVSSLLRMPGGQMDLVQEQALHLLGMLDSKPRLTLRVLHLEAPLAFVDTDFTLVRMKARKDTMLYVPFGLDGQMIKDRTRIKERERYWCDAEQAALSEEETREFLGILAERGYDATGMDLVRRTS